MASSTSDIVDSPDKAKAKNTAKGTDPAKAERGKRIWAAARCRYVWGLISLLIALSLYTSYVATRLSSLSSLRSLESNAESNNAESNATASSVSSPSWEPQYQYPPTNAFNGTSKHAYAFLIAGCNPENPKYLGFIYNAVVAVSSLRESGSKSDVIVLLRMATATNATHLPRREEDFLTSAGLIVRYLPKVKTDNFYTAVMDKYRILELTQYSRVLLFDADMMPLCNLDYVFEKSEGKDAVLQENLIIAGLRSAAQANFFMLTPGVGDYQKLRRIIQRREEEGGNQDGTFDEVNGWGHVIQPGDEWVVRDKNMTGLKAKNMDLTRLKWNFIGAMADQGLLYYWVKYVKKSVSIVTFDEVHTWGTTPNNKTAASDDDNNPVRLIRTDEQSLLQGGCTSKYKVKSSEATSTPWKDYFHFGMKSKPWMKPKFARDSRKVKNAASARNEHQLWYYFLKKAAQKHKYNLGLKTLVTRNNGVSLGLSTELQTMSENEMELI